MEVDFKYYGYNSRNCKHEKGKKDKIKDNEEKVYLEFIRDVEVPILE